MPLLEKSKKAREEAHKQLRMADFMLTQTFPAIQDPKILLAILENIFLGIHNMIVAALSRERHYKRIPPFQEEFSSQYNIFRLKIVPLYAMSKEDLALIERVHGILQAHKKSPMEFSAKGAFIICTGEYNLTKITDKDLKCYISKAKVFIQHIEYAILHGRSPR
jgi:hypothetical protein